jgi:hypothetical protein
MHVHLNNYDIITLPEEKKNLINLAHLKPLAEQEPPQPGIPCPWSLFQPIQGLPLLVPSMGKLNSLEPCWLLHINLLF